MSKKSLVIVCLALILILSGGVVSAGFFSDFWGKITGKVIVTDVTIGADGWTNWLNRDTPGGSGDWETRTSFFGLCASPTEIECRVISTQQSATAAGQEVICTALYGLACEQAKNNDNCYDYEVRFKCPDMAVGTGSGVSIAQAVSGAEVSDLYYVTTTSYPTELKFDTGDNACATVSNATNICSGIYRKFTSGWGWNIDSSKSCSDSLTGHETAYVYAARCGEGAAPTGTCEECVDGTHGWCKDTKEGMNDYCAVSAKFGEYYCVYQNQGNYITNLGDCVEETIPTCTDGDGHLSLEKQYYIRETATEKPHCVGSVCMESALFDDCINDNVLREAICENGIVSEVQYTCPEGCEEGVCISDLKISLATLKDIYQIGEQINLTDPPENVEGKTVSPKISLLEEEFFERKDVEILGYLIQLEEKPVVEKEIELKKELKKYEEKSISYSRKAREGIAIAIPFYNWRANANKREYSNIQSKFNLEISEQRREVKEEHEDFLSSLNEVFGTSKAILDNKIKKEFYYIFNGVLMNISEKEAEEIKKMSIVKEVYPNYRVEVFLDSSIPAMDFDAMKMYSELDGEGIVIAVIDTGIDANHESLDDLDDNPNTDDLKVIGWMDFVNFKPEPYDDHGHGTHVSGIAAGTGGSSDYAGVAPKAKLVGIKVLDSRGSGSFSDIIAGIEWVVQHKDEYDISVISMSLGANVNSDGTTPVEIAADYAVEKGINFIVAAGNAGGWGSNTVGIPASAFNVITVGAVDDDLELAWFSSRGPTKDGRIKPEVSAVGVDVTSSTPGNEYSEWSGTSMATPHVAGFVALLLQKDPSLTPKQIRDLLMQTGIDKGISGPDNDYGWGVVNGLETIFSLDPPEHEVGLLSLDVNNYFILNEENEIKTEIKNYGLNEERVDVKFFVDGIEIESKTIDLLSKETKEVRFNYVGSVKGEHEIKVLISGISGEVILDNNKKIKEVSVVEVLGTVKAVVVDSWGNHNYEYTVFDELNEKWFNYGDYVVEIDHISLKKEDITYEDITSTNADVLIISNAWANGDFGMHLEYTDSEIEAIKKYVEEGHGLIGTSGTLSELVTNNIKLAELFGIKEEIGLWNNWEAAGGGVMQGKNIDVLVEDDPLTKNLPVRYGSFPMTVLNLEFDETTGVVTVAKAEHRDDVFVSAYKPNLGASVYFTLFPEYKYATENDKQFFYNAILWANENIGALEKDIAIYDLQAPEKSRPNEEISISAKVKNNHLDAESITVNLLIDDEIIETKTLNLNSGQETDISFTFILNEIKNYEIKLEAVALSGETYLINNKVKSFLLVPGALLTNTNSEYLVDLGEDGKYDYLEVLVGVEVFEPGYYGVSLGLESYLGVELYPSAFAFLELNEEDNEIIVQIPLHLIKKYQLDGPYKIKNIKLKKDWNEILDTNEQGFVTGAYDYRSFRDPAKVILDSFSDYGLDENGNGLYDFLVIDFKVEIPVAGQYFIAGELGSLYAYANLEISESGIYEVNLKFNGIEIRKSKLDGPYDLQFIQIYSSKFLEREIKDVYTTNNYSYTDFEDFRNIRVGWIRNEYLIVGEENEIEVPIYNDGTEDVGEFDVSLYLEEELIGNVTIKGIAVNSFKDAVFNYIPTESGWLKFEVRADIEDDNEDDNSRKFSIRSYSERGADLTIYPYIWDKTYILGEKNKIDFGIGNRGIEKAEGIVVSLYNREGYYDEDIGEWVEKLTLIDSKRLGDLEVHEWRDDSFDYTPLEKNNDLSLIIEADNEVFPGDNKNDFFLRAKMKGADLTGYVDWNRLNFVVGTENKIDFNLENIGTETAKDIRVSLFNIESYYDRDRGWVQNLILIEQQELGKLNTADVEELVFTYVPEEELIGKYLELMINITSSNDVELDNNYYYFSKKVVPQSKIVNNKNSEFSGTLKIILQKDVNENWIDQQVVVNEEITIPAGDLVKLDYEWNPKNVVVNEEGGYRVYASFENEEEFGGYSWKFEVVK